MARRRDEFDDIDDEDGPAGIQVADDAEDDEPDSFHDVKLSPESVRELATTDSEAIDKRDIASRRRQRLGVENVQRPDRHHDTPQRQAAQSQVPERENPVAWTEGTSLEAPPCPPAKVMRWIRFKIGDRDDVKNTSKKFRQGWRPYLVKDCPANYSPPETAKTRFGEAISIGSLMLCVMPRELWKQRQQYYRERQLRQYKAAHSKFRSEEDPRLPIHQTNRETFTRGVRRPNVDG